MARMYCRIAVAARNSWALSLDKVPFMQTGFSLWLRSGLYIPGVVPGAEEQAQRL